MTASINGWLFSDDGYAQVSNAAVSDPAFVAGGAYTEAGVRFLVLDAGVVAGDYYVNGTRHAADGAMYYVTSAPSPGQAVNGIIHNHVGAMYISSSAPQTFYAGMGLRFDGALCEQGI